MDEPIDIEEEKRLNLFKLFSTPSGKRALVDPIKAPEQTPGPLSVSGKTEYNQHILPKTETSQPTRELITSPTPEHLVGYDPLFGFEDLVDVWCFIRPETKLHDWQAQELLRMSGWPRGYKTGERIHWYKNQPNIASYVCCNGSGKDDILIGTAAVGLPLLYRDMYVVATSASHEQLKNQTQERIIGAIRNLNSKLGFEYYDSVEFHHRHPITNQDTRGGQIKLFATDEAGRAEGWHPLTPTGRLALIINEAKTISAPILAAMDRCRGYSHWYEISSPGIRSGQFYRNYKAADKFADGAIAEPFKYFARKVDAFECPHISQAEINLVLQKQGYSSYIYQTSILANFAESVSDVIIPFSLVENCEQVLYNGGDEIGIGIDCAAGGDETTVWVRRGNKPVNSFFFQEKDTTIAAQKIDEFLTGYKNENYILNADDGGVGRGLLDSLANLGWQIYRRHNQSAALDNTLYGNFGAESYRHVRNLFEAKNIIPPSDEKTLLQLCTRKDSNAGGKFKLEPKKKIRAEGGESPDRADAFVLCFWSLDLIPAGTVPAKEPVNFYTQAELIHLAHYHPRKFAALFNQHASPTRKGRYTLLR